MSRHLGILPIPLVVIPPECSTAIARPIDKPARAIEPVPAAAPTVAAKPKPVSKAIPVVIGAGVLWWLLA